MKWKTHSIIEMPSPQFQQSSCIMNPMKKNAFFQYGCADMYKQHPGTGALNPQNKPILNPTLPCRELTGYSIPIFSCGTEETYACWSCVFWTVGCTNAMFNQIQRNLTFQNLFRKKTRQSWQNNVGQANKVGKTPRSFIRPKQTPYFIFGLATPKENIRFEQMCPKFFDAWVRLGTEIQHTVRTNNQSTTSWQGPSDEKPRQRSFPSCGAGQKRNGNWQQPQTKPQHAPCKKHVSPLAIQPWSYRCGWALYVHSGQHVLRGDSRCKFQETGLKQFASRPLQLPAPEKYAAAFQ